MLTPKPFEKGSDYPDICEWWRAHQFQYVPLKALPRVGVVIVDETGLKHCAGFLYTAESGWGWLEWVVANPAAPLKQKKEAINLLVQSLTNIAKGAGIERMISSLHSKGLVKIFENNGFRQGDSNATEMIWGGV
jgi:hypothetical protein